MNAKKTTVTLVANGVTQEFEISHAERVLNLPRTSWKLADNRFEFVDNALHYCGNKGKGKQGEKGGRAAEGETSSKQD